MDQTFLYVLGSHHVSDIFSRSLGKDLYWSDGAGLNPTYFKNELNFNNNEAIGHSVKYQFQSREVM